MAAGVLKSFSKCTERVTTSDVCLILRRMRKLNLSPMKSKSVRIKDTVKQRQNCNYNPKQYNLHAFINGRNRYKEKNNDIIAKAFPLNCLISPFDFYPLQSSTLANEALRQKQKDLQCVCVHYCTCNPQAFFPRLRTLILYCKWLLQS